MQFKNLRKQNRTCLFVDLNTLNLIVFLHYNSHRNKFLLYIMEAACKRQEVYTPPPYGWGGGGGNNLIMDYRPVQVSRVNMESMLFVGFFVVVLYCIFLACVSFIQFNVFHAVFLQ